MKFLIDADLPRVANDAVRKFGHEAVDVRDVGLRKAPDSQIARYAQEHALCLLTGDQDFGNMRNYPPGQYHGIVVLILPRNVTSKYVVQLLDSFLPQTAVLEQLDGKLAVVEMGRVRLRSI